MIYTYRELKEGRMDNGQCLSCGKIKPVDLLLESKVDGKDTGYYVCIDCDVEDNDLELYSEKVINELSYKFARTNSIVATMDLLKDFLLGRKEP
jgi:hypothetical protein